MNLSNIPQDKLLHFFYGAWISFISLLLLGLLGLLIPVIVAAGKEIIYDKIMNKGAFEIVDFIYTVVPTIMLYLVTLLNK